MPPRPRAVKDLRKQISLQPAFTQPICHAASASAPATGAAHLAGLAVGAAPSKTFSTEDAVAATVLPTPSTGPGLELVTITVLGCWFVAGGCCSVVYTVCWVGCCCCVV